MAKLTSSFLFFRIKRHRQLTEKATQRRKAWSWTMSRRFVSVFLHLFWALALDLKNYIMDDVQEVETYFPPFSVSTEIQNMVSCGRKAPQRETIGQKILPIICSSGIFLIVWLLHFQGSSNNHPCIRIAEDKGDEQSEVIEKTHHMFQPDKPQKVQSCNLCLERIRRSNQLWYSDICARRWIFVLLHCSEF